MAENFGDLSITIRVNKQTGELEVLKGQLADAQQNVSRLGQASEGTSGALNGLAGSLAKVGGAAAAAAVLAFLKQAIVESANAQEGFRILKAQMDALNLSFDANQERIRSWASSMQELANIEDDVVVAALGRTIQRVKDLDQAMKLVQLSQDIAIATGKNFESTLDMISRAAGGSQRGLQQLRMEFGAQLEGINNTEDALNRLGSTYGGASTKAQSAALSFAGLRRAFWDASEEIFNSVLPALQDLINTLGGPVMMVVRTVFVGIGQLTGQLVQEISSAAQGIKTLVEGAVEIAFYAFTGRLGQAKDAAVKLGNDLITLLKEDLARQSEIMKEGDKKLADIWSGRKETVRSNLADIGNIHAAASQQETQDVISAMNAQMAAIKEKEQLDLALSDTTLQQKLANANKNGQDNLALIQENIARKAQILNQAAADEVMLINATKSKVDDAEFKSAERINQVAQQLTLKQNKLRQDQLLAEKKAQDERAANFSSTLNFISTLATNKNKELAAIGKAAGIAQASIDTYAAANKALASAPPPFNFVLAGAVVAAGLANVARIASFAQGGVMTNKGPMPLKRYSNGGVANSPQMAEFGEGSGAEAYVPLPDGRRIPVQLTLNGNAAAGGNSLAVTVNMGGITIQMGGVDPNNVDYFLSELSRRLGTETAQTVTLALQLKNLADRNERTAV